MDTYLSGPSTSFTLPTIFSGAAFLGFGGVYNFTCMGNPTIQHTYNFYEKPFITLNKKFIYNMQLAKSFSFFNNYISYLSCKKNKKCL